MPLKAIREIIARFVNPPSLETTIGNHTYRLRSEDELWPLYFLHILADVGGLLKTSPARRWQLTAQGRCFLDARPMVQVPVLLAVWWYRVNWLVAYPVVGLGDRLPYSFSQDALAALQTLPVGKDISFEGFADGLICETGLTWTAPDSRFSRLSLHGAIQRMVIDPLVDFGALECRYQEEPLGKGTLSRLVAFRITPWGIALLETMDR
jgi:hypothetical protein